MAARGRLALRLGGALLRVGGRLAGAVVLVGLALGAFGLLTFEAVEEATCGYDATQDGCVGADWAGIAWFIGALTALALACLALPLWLAHLAARRRARRLEALHAARLLALDSWRMSGKVAADRHADVKARLRTLLAAGHPAQVARHAGAALAGFAAVWLAVGAAGAFLVGIALSDGALCDQGQAACGRATAASAASWTALAAGAAGTVLGLAGNAAARRAEARAWQDLEADWDAILEAGSGAPRRATARPTGKGAPAAPKA